jgi:cytochrome b561
MTVDETVPSATPPEAVRYDPVAVFLHWVIGLAIIFMLALGFTMEDYPQSWRFTAYNLHKALGITILGFSLFRLIWRFMNPPPPLPAHMKRWERVASYLSHWGLYAIIVVLPLSGWLMVSAKPKYPIAFFGLGEAPFIPMPTDAYLVKFIQDLSHETHELLPYGAVLLIVIHAGAALKHHFVDQDFVLMRMLPRFLTRR